MGDSIKPKNALKSTGLASIGLPQIGADSASGTSTAGLFRHANAAMPHTWLLGKKDSAKYDLGGQIVGAYDNTYYKPEDQPQIPYTDPLAGSMQARDIQRRRARLAQGVASTIHAGSLAKPVSTAPAALLGS